MPPAVLHAQCAAEPSRNAGAVYRPPSGRSCTRNANRRERVAPRASPRQPGPRPQNDSASVKNKPRNQRCVFLVLPPWWTKRLSNLVQPELHVGAELRGSQCEQIFFANSHAAQTAFIASTPDDLAEKLTFRGVNRRVRRERLFQCHRQPSGTEQDSA